MYNANIFCLYHILVSCIQKIISLSYLFYDHCGPIVYTFWTSTLPPPYETCLERNEGQGVYDMYMRETKGKGCMTCCLTGNSGSPLESIMQRLHFFVFKCGQVFPIFAEPWHSWPLIFLKTKRKLTIHHYIPNRYNNKILRGKGIGGNIHWISYYINFLGTYHMQDLRINFTYPDWWPCTCKSIFM